MGPNGSGKSTLSKVLAGHPDYKVLEGTAKLDDQELLGLEPDEISRLGLFLAFQYPIEVPGVSIANFIRSALQARLPEGESVKAVEYYKSLYEKMDALGMDRKFTSRSLNEGFSGGKRKDARYCKCLFSTRNIAFLMRPTVVWTLMRSKKFHKASIE